MQASTCSRKNLYMSLFIVLTGVKNYFDSKRTLCGGEKNTYMQSMVVGHAFIFLPFF
jgi:hypothetical protein